MTIAPRTPTVLQHEVCECGLAALAMLMGHHGCHVPLHELRVVSGVSRDGTSMLRLRDVARQYGFHARAVSREPDRLAELGLPVMAFVNFNHMVVIEDIGPRWVRLNDPAGGPTRVEREQFERMFTGIALHISPGPAFAKRAVPHGFPRLLRPTMSAWRGLVVLLVAEVAVQLLATLFLLGSDWRVGVAALFGLVVSALAAERLGQAFSHRLHGPLSDTLFTRCASYIGTRSLPFLGLLAEAGGALGQALGAAAALIARLGVSMVPLVALALHHPASAGVVTGAGVACAGMVAIAYARRGSSWARSLRGDGRRQYSLPLEAVLDSPSLMLGGRDDDLISALAGSRAEGSALASRVAFAEAMLGAAVPSILAVAVAVSTALGGGAAMGLAALAVWPWLGLRGLPLKLSAIRRLCGMMADLETAPQAKRTVPDAASDGVLEATGLAFGYGTGAPALFAGLSLRAEAGSQVAITGPAGAGKSTFARVLAGHLVPWEGRVAAGGRVILVPDHPVLFEGTLTENVTLWDRTITAEQARQALALVGLWEEVGDRQVEPGGRNLSGGQRRRVEMARALVRDPKVLVVDEALDGLDLAGERRIRDALRRLGITLVLVTQRVETLADCELVLTLGSSAPASSGAAATADEGAQPPKAPTQKLAPDQAAALKAVAGFYRVQGDLETHPPFGIDPLRWAARVLGLHVRRVRLRGAAWRRRGSEPLIAHTPGHGWTAVLPRLWGGYRVDAGLDEEAFAVQPRPPSGAFGFSFLWRLVRQAIWPETWGLAAGMMLWGCAAGLASPGSAGIAAASGLLVGGAGFMLAKERATARLSLRAELALTAHLLRLPYTWLARQGRATAVRWMESCNQVLGRAVGDAFSLVVHGAAAMAVLALLEERQAALAAGGALVVAALGPVVFRLMDAEGRARASDAAWRVLAGLLRLPASARTEELRARWQILQRSARSRQDALRLADCLGDAVEVAIVFAWAGYLLTVSPAATPLGLVAILALRLWARALAGLVAALGEGHALAALIHAPVEDGGPKPLNHDGSLRVKGVGFAYPGGKPLLDGVDFAIGAGEVVAVLGPSGAGKSTLLALVLGLLQPQEGTVTSGGWSMAQVDRTLLRFWCDGVLQDEILPLATVRNYLLASSVHDVREAWQALAVVGLAETVAAWPMGIHSVIEERTVSAGQAQQLRLARALIRRPRLLVLDEATGALDPARQDMVFNEIRRRGITTLFAAHRADSASLADHVYRLDGGRLVAQRQPKPELARGGNSIPFTPPPPLSIYRASALMRFEGPEILDRIAELPTPKG